MPTIKVSITSDELDRDECANCDSEREDEESPVRANSRNHRAVDTSRNYS